MTKARIAVVGSGAIGTYYGAKLAAAGRDVHFLMRSDFEAAQKNGVHLVGAGEDVHLSKVNAYRTTAEIGPCDLVIIALKTTSNAVLADLVPPLLHENTILLTLQNGLGNEELLAENFGAERVMAGLCFICLIRTTPGTVERFDYGHLRIGEFSRPSLERTHKIAQEFRESGVDCGVADNLALERWRKLVWNVPFNGLSILGGGLTTAQILADNPMRTATVALMEEVIAGANRLGLPLTRDVIEVQMQRTEEMGAYKPSTLLDYEAGRPLEIEAIWGEPFRRATSAGAVMPRLQMLYAALRSLDQVEQTKGETR